MPTEEPVAESERPTQNVCTLSGMLRTVVWVLAIAFMSDIATAADLDFAHGLYRQRRYNLAAQEYQEVLKTASGERALQARFFLAECYSQMGEPQKALPIYDNVLKSNARANRYYQLSLFRHGQLSLQIGSAEQARKSLQSYVELAQGDHLASAYYFLGEAELARGESDAAARAFEQSLRNNPTAEVKKSVEYGRARLAEKRGDVDTAIKTYRQLSMQASSSVADDALLALGALLYQSGQFDQALVSFQQMNSRFPNSPLLPQAELNAGLTLQKLDRLNEAIDRFLQIIGNQETAYRSVAPEAWLRLGLTYETKGQWQLASQTYKDGIRNFEGTPHAQRLALQLSKGELAFGDPKQAIESLRNQLPKTNGDRARAEIWVQIAQAASRLKDSKTIKQALEAVTLLRDAPSQDVIAIALAETLIYSGSPAQAEDQIRQLRAKANTVQTRNRFDYLFALAAFEQGNYAKTLQLLSSVKKAGSTSANEQNYLRGMSLSRLGRTDEAAPLLLEFLQASDRDELNTAVARELGKILTQSPNASDLLRAFTNSLSGVTESAPIWTAVGDGLYEGGQVRLAEQFYNRALRSQPGDELRHKISLALTWCLIERNDNEDALRKLNSLKRQSDQLSENQKIEIAFLAGVIYEKKQRTDEALQAYNEVLVSPKNQYQLDAAKRAANLLASTDIGRARQFLNLAEEQLSDDHKAAISYERAWLVADSGDKEQAIQDFEQFLASYSSSPQVTEARLKLAELHYLQGNFEEALKQTELIQDSSLPKDFALNLYFRRGVSAFRLQKYTVAQQAFTQLAIVADRAMQRTARFWLAEIAFEQGELAGLLDAYQNVIEDSSANQYNALSQLRLAQIHLKQKEWQQALNAAQTALKLPDTTTHSEAKYVQARSLQQQAKFEQARSIYEKIANDRGSELGAKSAFMLAETYMHQRRFDDALKAYLKVEILYPFPTWQSMALLQVAKCHSAMGEADKAQEALSRLRTSFPNSEAARISQNTQPL